MSYKTWKSNLAEKAENIIKTTWPDMLTTLTDKIASENLSISRISKIRKGGIVRQIVKENGVTVGAKRKRPSSDDVTENGDHKKSKNEEPALGRPLSSVKFVDNEAITEIFADEKELALGLIDNVQNVRMWITFNVPKIEDGNNFGVSVQEEILNELKSCETEYEALLSSPSAYYASRGKIISKCIKYPEIKDYQNYIEECDEKAFLMHRMVLTDIRNSLASLLDLLDKNMDKIKKPKGSKSSMHMY